MLSHTLGSVLLPSAHALQPLLLWRVAKNSPGPGAASAQPVGERAFTSAGPVHTWKPFPHRSATSQPIPEGFSLSLPATCPQAGAVVSSTPGRVQPPEHAAMFGYIA